MRILARLLVIQTIIVLVQTLEFPSFTTSGDQHLTVGSTLDLNCSVDLSTVQASQQPIDVYKIMIKKGSQSPAESAIFIHHNDSLTLQMIIPNITLHDDGTYTCYYGNSTMIQSLTTVRIGDPPGPPVNVTCWSNSFNDLQCSFCLSKQSVNLPVRWSMEYKLDDQFKNISDCSSPPERSGEVCLICAKYHGYLIIFGTYTISINGVNEDFQVNIRQHFEVELKASIVIVSPVDSLTYSYTPVSSVVNLMWGFPAEVSRDIVTVDYKITVTSEEDWDSRVQIFHQRNREKEVYVLTDLKPYANYTVTVQAKSVDAEGDLYWSNKSTVIFTTQDDVSYHPVSITSGSYVMVDCGLNYTCLILYWKNPERKFWNAPITSYLVDIERENVTGNSIHEEAGNHSVLLTSSWTENITGPAVSSTVNYPMMKTSYYVVKLSVVNRQGVSPKHAELVIPSWDKGQQLRPDWVAVEISQAYVKMTWYISHQYCDNVSMATYYWCTEDTERAMNSSVRLCKDNLDWVTVDLKDGECGNETSLMLNNTLNIPNVKYAVSIATSSNHSGGMKWENFQFKALGRVPIKPLFTVQPAGSSLTVEILYNEYYVSDGGRPLWYWIMYSEVSNSGPIDCSSDGQAEKFPASFSSPSYTMNNMSRGTKYVVCVAAGNSAGMSSYGEPFSVTIPADPLENSGSTLTIVLSVSLPLGILVVILLVVGIICCRKKCNKWKIDNNKITIPEYADETLMNGSYNMRKINKDASWDFDNHDSGKGSDSGVISSRQEVPLHQQNGQHKTQKCAGPALHLQEVAAPVLIEITKRRKHHPLSQATNCQKVTVTLKLREVTLWTLWSILTWLLRDMKKIMMINMIIKAVQKLKALYMNPDLIYIMKLVLRRRLVVK